MLSIACADGSGAAGTTSGGTDTGGTDTGGTDTDGTDTDGSTATAGTGDPPPRMPGTNNSSPTPLPGDEPTACEWEWTVRTLTYLPGAVVPRRMYFSACDKESATPKMFTSLTVGENAPHPEEDPSSGGIIVSQFDPETSTLETIARRHFPECISMHGVTTSRDCSTIAALCRIPSGTDGFDKDVLATHNAADWMTNPYECGDRGLNDEMWLYEWTDGDIQSEPSKFIVHKSIGSWEYGNNYLHMSEQDNTYGIAMKATVGGDGGSTCHEADAFLVMDRNNDTYTNRGWSWACGVGHTIMNRLSFNPVSNQYALMCSTDYNADEVGGLGALSFRADGQDKDGTEFHYYSRQGLANKGGASAVVPSPDGGFLGVFVATSEDDPPAAEYPLEPATAIGLGHWNAQGVMQGPMEWVAENPTNFLSYSNLAPLDDDHYLLGWGVMNELTEDDFGRPQQIPSEFWIVEIDGDGNRLTEAQRLEGTGWGEVDQMVSLGDRRVAWGYIANPALTPEGEHPDCNQPQLQMTVYTAAE